MSLFAKYKETMAARAKEKADEAVYCGEGERLRTGVYLKKHVSERATTTFEYRDEERAVWLAHGKISIVSGSKVISLRSESWCSLNGARDAITPELRKRIIADLKRSRQGIFVDRSVYPEEEEK